MSAGPAGRPEVLMVAGRYPPALCGVADYIRCLVDSLTQHDLSVSVLTREDYSADPWPVRGAGRIWDRRTIRQVVDWVKTRRPGVVHIQYQAGVYDGRYEICFLGALLRAHTRSRVVTTFHDLNGPPRWGRLHRLGVLALLMASHRVVVCSNRQYLAVSRIPLIGRRVERIPVGPAITPPAGVARSAHCARENCSVVFFGFVWRGRGLESVIAACADAAARGYSLKLTIVGGIPDAQYAEELRDAAARSGLGPDQLVFTGEMPAGEVSRLLLESDFCVLPFPSGVSTGRSTFASCAAHALPIITTYDPVNCPSELVHGGNVLLYRPGDVESLTTHIESLCSSPELREHLSQGIAAVADSWQWRGIALRHLAVYGIE